jgi:hypothetical protein
MLWNPVTRWLATGSRDPHYTNTATADAHLIVEPIHRIWGFQAVVMKSTIFWDTTPCSLWKVDQHSRNVQPPSSAWKMSRVRCQSKSRQQGKPPHLPSSFIPVSCSAYFLTLKMEGIWSLVMWADFQWIHWVISPKIANTLHCVISFDPKRTNELNTVYFPQNRNNFQFEERHLLGCCAMWV